MPNLLGENRPQRTGSIPRSLSSGNVLVTNKGVCPHQSQQQQAIGQPQTALESLFWPTPHPVDSIFRLTCPHPGQPQSAPDSGQQYHTQRGGSHIPVTGSSPSVIDHPCPNQPVISSPTYTDTSAFTLTPSIRYATQFCVSKATQPSTSSTAPNNNSQSGPPAPASFKTNTFSEFLVSSSLQPATGHAPKIEKGFKKGKYTAEDVQMVESILFPPGKPFNWNRQMATTRYVTAEKTNRAAVSATMSHNGICKNCYCGGITPPPVHSLNECRAQNNPCQLVCPKCPGRYHWLKDCPRQKKSKYYRNKAGKKSERTPVEYQTPRGRLQPSAHQQIRATRPGNRSKY